MSEEEKKKYWKRREILRSTLLILEANPGEIARLRAYHFCRSMTDLSVDGESPRGPDIPELPEPGAEPSERVAELFERMEESDGYFRPDRVPGRSTGSASEAAQAIARPDRDSSNHEDGEEEDGEESSGESEDTRIARYLRSTMSEVSDPDMWVGLHYLPSGTESDEEQRPRGSTDS